MHNLRTTVEKALQYMEIRSATMDPEERQILVDLRAALAAEQPQPEADERADDEALRREMADILTRTATALRGPPGPREAWGWADLPERAEAAIAAITAMTLAAKYAAAPTPPAEAVTCSNAALQAFQRFADYDAKTDCYVVQADDLRPAITAALAAKEASRD